MLKVEDSAVDLIENSKTITGIILAYVNIFELNELQN
jgi:hypothetical protein